MPRRRGSVVASGFATQNLFTADLTKASVVTLSLLQNINERRRPKLVRTLKLGTRIVSHVFNMGPERPPEKTVMGDRTRIFLWSLRTWRTILEAP